MTSSITRTTVVGDVLGNSTSGAQGNFGLGSRHNCSGLHRVRPAFRIDQLAELVRVFSSMMAPALHADDWVRVVHEILGCSRVRGGMRILR
jgi:hypothetical protein